MFPVSGRDFVCVAIEKKIDDKIFSAAISIKYEMVPEVKGVVRG